MDVSIRLALALLMTALSEAIKNPARKAALKKYLLVLRDQISALYPEGMEAVGGKKLTVKQALASLLKG